MNEAIENFNFRTCEDICEEYEIKMREILKNGRWGDWVFNHKLLTLTHEPEDYEIDLEEITTSAKMLDWIFQLWNKQWTRDNPKIISDLISAFQDLLHPQANYCSFGSNKIADPKKVISKGFNDVGLK